MGSSLIVISLALLTLVIGIAIAIYQLWSAHESQKKGNHSALAARFGGKPMSKAGLGSGDAAPGKPADPAQTAVQ